MKKTFATIAVAALAITASAQQTIHVSGKLEGLGDSLLYNLIDMNLEQARTKGTFPVAEDGSFDFTLPIGHVASLYVMNNAIAKSEDAASKLKPVGGIAVPGEHMVLTGSVDNCTLSGSAFYQEYAEVDAFTNKLTEKYHTTPREQYDSLRNAIDEEVVAYIKVHPDKESAASLIPILTYTKAQEAIDALTPEVRDGRMADYYKPYLKMQKDQEERTANSVNIKAEKPAPDFTLNDLSGNPFTLSSLRGKYVILDFWGSWCYWCMKGMPAMKECYEKHKGKLEILGVDSGDTEEKWKEAVEKEQLPWLHVRSAKEDNVPMLYAVSGYPTKIVINPDGTINKVFVGEDESMYEYIDELMK